MSNINLELHTSIDLNIGAKLEAEIKVIESLNSEEETKSVAIKAQMRRTMRVIGYVDRTPQYTNVVADQFLQAMQACNLDRVEVEVFEKVEQKIDDRNIYLLSINNEDVVTHILTANTNLKDLMNTVEEKSENTSGNANEIAKHKSNTVEMLKSSFNSKELVERALIELSGGDTSERNEGNKISDEDFKTEIKRLVITGAAKDNPAKMQVINLIKEGSSLNLSLEKDANSVINVIYNGIKAGEVNIESLEDMITISDVVSVVTDGTKPFGYYVKVELKVLDVDSNNSELHDSGYKGEKHEEMKSMFVDLIKPVLQSKISVKDEIAITAEEIKLDESVIDGIWKLVAMTNGIEIEEPEIESADTLEIETVASEEKILSKPMKAKEEEDKKITAEEIKKIMSYLSVNNVPKKYIDKIIKSYKKYSLRYLERIPSYEDESFTPWKYSGKGENLLQIAIIMIEKGKNLRFVGGKGAGKNTLLSTLAWVYQRPLFSQSANRDTDITHLFGDKTIDAVDINGQIAQTVEFEKGLLIEAMEIGGFYEYGEGNASRAEVTMALHSVLDSRREADVNGYKLVKATEGFTFVLTMNVDYEGCNSLNEAFRDRFVTIPFPSPRSIAQVLRQACPSARNKDIQVCDRLYSDILDRVDELQNDEIVTIRGYINALDLSEDLDLKTALKMCVAYNVSDDDLIVREILEIIDSVVA